MLSTILWGLRHRRLIVRVYTVLCLAWLLLLIGVCSSLIVSNPSLGYIAANVITIVLLGFPPIGVIAYLKGREEKGRAKKMIRQRIVDPYLISAKEKITAMERYFEGETSVSWSPIITLAHDSLISVLQRMIIDLKGSEGVPILEQLRREKKLYMHTLARLLKESGVIDEEEMKNLEILRDIRNRVVHEDYHPSREQALWALNFVKTFVLKHYPELEL